MVLKSNRSALWRHIIGTCRRPRWLCRKHSNNVVRHDETSVESKLLSHSKNILSCGTSFCDVGVTLCYDFYTFRSYNTSIFSVTTCAVLQHMTYDIIFCCFCPVSTSYPGQSLSLYFSPRLRRLPWHRGSFLWEYLKLSMPGFECRTLCCCSLLFRHFVFSIDSKTFCHTYLCTKWAPEIRSLSNQILKAIIF